MAVCDDGPAAIAESPAESNHSHKNGKAHSSPNHSHGGHHHHSACDHRHDHHAERSRHERAIDRCLEAGADSSLEEVLEDGDTKHSRQRRGGLRG
jgi:hypothetical protein